MDLLLSPPGRGGTSTPPPTPRVQTETSRQAALLAAARGGTQPPHLPRADGLSAENEAKVAGWFGGHFPAGGAAGGPAPTARPRPLDAAGAPVATPGLSPAGPGTGETQPPGP